MNELILATSNLGKIKELTQLLSPIHCISQDTLAIHSPPENGLSFIENAIIKARHASFLAQKPALADDSGLVVPVLDGAPGIYSARYAGDKASDEENINLLLKKMHHLQGDQRRAYFYCVLVLMQHAQDPSPIIATGIFHGLISTRTSGLGGFGYDPIFFVLEHQCTAAELPAVIKNKISHRAKALEQLMAIGQHK